MTNWQRVGAWTGGSSHAIAASPQFAKDGLVFATTGAGVYRSTDGGQHWSLSSGGIDDPSALAVAIAPADPSIAYVSTEQGRLYRTSDAGESWQEISSWAGLGIITSMMLSPNFAADGTMFAATPNGVFRTFDSGAEWQEASFGLLDLDVLCLACAPDFADSGVLWAGTALGGFFRSRNSALAWREYGNGLPDCAIQSLVVSPSYSSDRSLFVGTETDGVYVSQNGGASWLPMGESLRGQCINGMSIIADSSGDFQLIVGTADGVYSLDGALESSQSAGEGNFLALDIATAMDGTVFAATYQEGVYYSTDCGLTWQQTGHEIVAHPPPVVIKVPPDTLYMLDVHGQTVQTDTQGNAWRIISLDSDQSPVLALAAGQRDGPAQLAALTDEALFIQDSRSAEKWQIVPTPQSGFIGVALTAADPDPTSILLYNGVGKLLIADVSDGEWDEIETPWSGEAILQLDFSRLSDSAQTLYAITASGNERGNFDVCVWQTTNRGTDWETLATLETEVPAVLWHQVGDLETQSIILATQHRIVRLYREQTESDAKADLAVEQHFFNVGTRVTALTSLASYGDQPILYAATNDGIFTSVDRGNTWESLCELPANRPVVALFAEQIESGALHLVAVTLGGQIWKLTIH